MQEQHFSHVNELLAMAPLNADGDRHLFKSQLVQLNEQGLVQWDFILNDDADWHFTQNVPMLSSEEKLKAFKECIRQKLKRIIEQRTEQAR